MRIVIDTCIIIDFATGRDEDLMNNANHILAQACFGKYECFVTAKALTDIYYILHKCCHDKSETSEYLQRFTSYISILDVNESDCKKALSSQVVDYEDAVLDECADRNKIDYIVTDNVKDFGKAKVKAISSSDFLELLWKNVF